MTNTRAARRREYRESKQKGLIYAPQWIKKLKVRISDKNAKSEPIILKLPEAPIRPALKAPILLKIAMVRRWIRKTTSSKRLKAYRKLIIKLKQN